MANDTSSQEYLDLKTELRSILISSQQGCNEQQLLRDYAAYNSRKEIPFRNMGYRNLIELLASMPDVARIDQSKMPLIIHGVADQSTAHIKKFVMTQKKKKPSRNARGGVNRYGFVNRTNVSATYPRYRQTQYDSVSNHVPFQPYHQITNTNTNHWDTYNLQNVPPPQSFSTISYSSSSVINTSVQNPNHFIPLGINQSSVSRAVASFPPKSTATPPPPPLMTSVQETPTIDDNSSVMDDDLNYSEDDELASYDAQKATEHGEKIILLRKRIRQLLLKYPSGIWLTSVDKLYKKLFDEDLNLEEYKLKNLMAFFDCVADFVNSERDRRADSTDRLLLLKRNFTEATKREQQTAGKIELNTSLSSGRDNPNLTSPNQDSPRYLINEIDRPIVDLSAFVSLDFHYKRIDYTLNQPFHGFLGDVEDPWVIHIGNVQFIPKRDCMMAQMQDHYDQSFNQSIYIIPFEQLQINLSCVYYSHIDKLYYRAFIIQIDPLHNSDIYILKLYLVDYGKIISDIQYHMNSTNLKFLHKNFSTLSTQVYDCRLANVQYPMTSVQWPDDARQFIIDLCQDIDFTVELVGLMDSFYCVYLYIDSQQQSINRLLIQQGIAIEFDDTQYSGFEPISSDKSSNPVKNYIDERLLCNLGENNIEYNIEENNLKQFIISIEHAYYFVKHPYTKRPCLPCFEVARLLDKDEKYVSQLNLIRENEVSFSDSYRMLFDDLRCLTESRRCPHINRNDNVATIILYDLSSIRDYLCKIKFREGDVIDAFFQEYNDYERVGYWNEKKNSYTNNTNLESHQGNLNQKKDMLNFRKEQLRSLSTTNHQPSYQNEMEEIDQKLNHLDQELHCMETILPSTTENNSLSRPTVTKRKSSNKKMRETLYRIAAPFDQQFSLNLCFNHQLMDNNTFHNDNEIEERFQDLHRITKNVLDFSALELELSDKNNRDLLENVIQYLPDLIENNTPYNRRIEVYNYCLQIIQYFQPIIQGYVQRTDLLDTIY